MTADSVNDYDVMVAWLTNKVAAYLNEDPATIGLDTALADLGIDSAASLALCADLQREKGIAVETTMLWDLPTIEAIAAHLTDRATR